jgi:Zn ribbon nucleic-acid-binding protein
MKKCPQCKSELKKVMFDVGYGVHVESLHCSRCGINITKNDRLKKALSSLREQMTKKVC